MRSEVEESLGRPDLTPRVRERLEMVKAVALSYAIGQITTWSGREARTIRRWVRAYSQWGLVGLTDAARSGPWRHRRGIWACPSTPGPPHA